MSFGVNRYEKQLQEQLVNDWEYYYKLCCATNKEFSSADWWKKWLLSATIFFNQNFSYENKKSLNVIEFVSFLNHMAVDIVIDNEVKNKV